MGIIKALGDSISSTFADQWKDIYTVGVFDEHIVVSPGILKRTNNGRGNNFNGSDGVISNGSKIYVPENTAAFIFSQSGIENIITTPGGFEYQDGQGSIFNGDGVTTIFAQLKDRIGYGGISSDYKKIAFVNLREIRDIKFGTRGAQVYNDLFYGIDLEIYAYGAISVQVVNPELFIRNFIPANVNYYSFDDQNVRGQLIAEFLQSFAVALNSLSTSFRISQIPSHANEIAQQILNDKYNAGTWESRFGLRLNHVAIENIEFSDKSREIVNKYSSNKMKLKAYEDISEKASNIAAQQKIAEGIKDNGLGNAGGMLFGMNIAQNLDVQAKPQPCHQRQTVEKPVISVDEQIETLKKLKDLVDIGILTEEEFITKKKEIMGL